MSTTPPPPGDDPAHLPGLWNHSLGGVVTISKQGDAYVIVNAHTNEPAKKIPADSFVQPSGIHYYRHVGQLSAGSIINWSNGSTWIKQGSVAAGFCRYFVVRGKVQNVMFRQTIIRAMQSRGISGGGTNHSEDRNRVDLTFMGEQHKVNEIVNALREGKQLNNWGAQADSLQEFESGIKIEDHQVNTTNVDQFSWNPNVTMYI
eukprot:gnl/TRDRNA2_/TRDRNA2_135306_c0_seq1.p1 gnl/TRDRNA2_/TRDRNA2_135306_c0~~gnl/TRDRNA2_/TRDRNA2_135306_c0_seq1.p1  ORF type:complete len:203 (+),score=29.65 gnl/TRDRNA2_/TRDRNA2_135306_c0_seq1:137-745(+)